MHQITRYFDREYSARRTACGDIGVSVNFIAPVYRRRHVVMSDEASAQSWLGENGLPRSEARKLLGAALRSEGEFTEEKILKNFAPPFPDKDLRRDSDPGRIHVRVLSGSRS